MTYEWNDGDYAVAELRVSSDEEKQKSIPDQEAICRRVAAYLELPLEHVIITTESRSLWPRETTAKTLRLCEDVHARALIVWRDDRLIGDPRQQQEIFETLDETGTLLFDGDRRLLNSGNEGDEFVSIIQAAKAKMEVKTIRKRMYDTNREKFLAGKLVTRPPYGIHNAVVLEPDTGQPVYTQRGRPMRRFEKDPAHWPIVEEIFQLTADGMTFGEMESLFERLGRRTATGAVFSKQRLREIVGNEFYIGLMTFGRRKTKWRSGRKAIELRPNEEVEVREHELGALIDPALFARAQDEVKRRYHVKGGGRGNRKHAPRPLDGLVYCGRCDSRMFPRRMAHVRKDGKQVDAYSYYCGGTYSIYSACRGKSHSIAERKLVKAIKAWAVMPSASHDNEVVVSLRMSRRSERQEEALTKALDKLPDKEERTFRAYQAELISFEKFAQEKQAIKAERAELEGQLAKIRQPRESALPPELPTVVGKELEEAIDLWFDPEIAIEERQAVAGQLLHRLVVDRGQPIRLVLSTGQFTPMP